MELRRRTAAALAGLVVLLGGAAGCTAADTGTSAAPSGQTGQGPGGRPSSGFDTTALVTALADGLGLDETTVQTAVDDAMASAMGDRQSPPSAGSEAPTGQPSTPPSGAPGEEQGGGGLAQRLAEAIATELGVDQADVLAIVEQHLPIGGPGRGGDEQPPSGSSTP